MIAEKALRLAGENAHLVARPAGRLHVYTGPLTPSGRYVPRSARTVCRTRTRRLEVRDLSCQVSSLEAGSLPAVCGRCSARLIVVGRAEQHPQPVDRAGFLRQYGHLEKGDLAFALELATTPAEVDAAAHLTLALFNVAGAASPFVHRGRTWSSLHHLVAAARTRVRGYPESYYRSVERAEALSAAGREAAIARRREIHEDREARIARIGITNVKPTTGRTRRPANRGATR